MLDIRSQIGTITDYWTWLQDTLPVQLRAQPWYNNQPPRNLSGFLNDKASRLIGWATMRQLRIQSESCHLKQALKSFFAYCKEDYSFFNEEKRSFEPGWGNVTSMVSNTSIERAFQYQSSAMLNSSFVVGKHQTYGQGGYVYDFRGRLADLKGNLSALRQLNWIDGQTRAVVIQFTIYNPNVQLFTAGTLLTEFLSTGGVETLSNFQPISFSSKSIVAFAILLPIGLSPSVQLVGAAGVEHSVSVVHRLHDVHRGTVADPTEESVLPSVLVVHRARNHHLRVDLSGHLHMALSRVEQHR